MTPKRKRKTLDQALTAAKRLATRRGYLPMTDEYDGFVIGYWYGYRAAKRGGK